MSILIIEHCLLIADASDLGQDDCAAGKPIAANPHPMGRAEHAAYRDAWLAVARGRITEAQEEMDRAEAAGQVGWRERLCSFVAWVFRKPSAGDV